MSVTLSRYWIIFALLYGMLLFLKFFLFKLFNIDLGILMDGLILFSAAAGSVFKFVSDNKRPPNKIERRKLVWGSLAITFVLSVLVSVVLALNSEEISTAFNVLFQNTPVIALVFGFFFMALLYFILLHFTYGWGVRKYAQKYLQIAQRNE